MTKTAVVIGATGLVGSELLTALLSCVEYSKVVAITRRALPLSDKKLTNHIIDFEKLTQYSELFKGDVFFSCLGTTLKQAGSVEAQRKVDFDYQFIAAQLASCNGMKHYCLVSSSGANANSSSAYLKMKGQLEQAVMPLAFNKTSVFQPSLLLGARDHFRLAEKLGSVILPLLTKVSVLKRYKPITGKQVAVKMLLVSLKQEEAQKYYVLDELFE
ncbi:NADH dehydrogenase [Pseudoalteromonas sp. 10-33]|uniref:NADH dehydrogenase n=1 Tax=Pseudoalteromonas sp. 10-33 TaxID=1761890 RepID=UPI00073244BF|nr:NADH dehydrogenase [Pseudoalteromonas sp. 10-33]KTF19073.1 NADH dehydrogenase [Pseudoalteromonas sp. 10-33]